MAVAEWFVRGATVIGVAVVGFFVVPIAISALWGLLAGAFAIAGAGVPTVLTLDFLGRFTPLLAVGGAVLGAGWVVSR